MKALLNFVGIEQRGLTGSLGQFGSHMMIRAEVIRSDVFQMRDKRIAGTQQQQRLPVFFVFETLKLRSGDQGTSVLIGAAEFRDTVKQRQFAGIEKYGIAHIAEDNFRVLL